MEKCEENVCVPRPGHIFITDIFEFPVISCLVSGHWCKTFQMFALFFFQRVEMASEFAVSNAFHLKKPHSRISRPTVPLQSSEQLQDHDDSYSEGRSQDPQYKNMYDPANKQS